MGLEETLWRAESACVACVWDWGNILCVWVVRFLIVIAFHYMTGCLKVVLGPNCTYLAYTAKKKYNWEMINQVLLKKLAILVETLLNK